MQVSYDHRLSHELLDLLRIYVMSNDTGYSTESGTVVFSVCNNNNNNKYVINYLEAS